MEGVTRKQARSTISRKEGKKFSKSSQDTEIESRPSLCESLFARSRTLACETAGRIRRNVNIAATCGARRHKHPPSASNCQKVKTNVTLSICVDLLVFSQSVSKCGWRHGFTEICVESLSQENQRVLEVSRCSAPSR